VRGGDNAIFLKSSAADDPYQRGMPLKGKAASSGAALHQFCRVRFLLIISVKTSLVPATAVFRLELNNGICDTVGQHADTTRNGHFIQ
jgi:hypothetical protein